MCPCTYFMTKRNHSLGSIITLKKTFLEVMSFSWYPDRLLRVIGPHHILTLHLNREILKYTIEHIIIFKKLAKTSRAKLLRKCLKTL